MKTFGEWFADQGKEPELPEGLWETNNGKLMYECRGCGCSTEWEWAIEEFDIQMRYCGGSPRCLP